MSFFLSINSALANFWCDPGYKNWDLPKTLLSGQIKGAKWLEGISGVSIRKKMKAALWLAVFWERNVHQFEASTWGPGTLCDSGPSSYMCRRLASPGLEIISQLVPVKLFIQTYFCSDAVLVFGQTNIYNISL